MPEPVRTASVKVVGPEPKSFEDALAKVLRDADQHARQEKLDGLMALLRRDQMSDALAGMQSLEKRERWLAMTTLFHRWAELDPAAAIKRTKAMELDLVSSVLWRELLVEWAERDVRAARVWAEAQPAGRRRREAVAAVAEVLVKTDARAAVQMLEPAEVRDDSLADLEKIFGIWASQDFAGATAYALQNANARIQEVMFRALLNSQSARPPRENLDWVIRLPNPQFREEAMTKLIKQWISTDTMGAMEYVVGLKLSQMRRDLLSSGIAQLARENPEKARILFGQLSSTVDRDLVLDALIHEGLDRDKDRTLEFVKSLPDEKERAKAMAEVVSTMANAGLLEAKEWLALIPQGSDRTKAVGAIAEMIGKTDLKAAAQFCLEQLNPDESGHMPISDAVANWWKADQKAALDWLHTLPEGRLRTGLVHAQLTPIRLSSQQSAENIERAAAFDSKTHTEVANQVMAYWISNDVKAAADWVSKMPPSAGQRRAVGIAAYGMVQQKPQEALLWLNQLHGPAYDAAAANVAGGLPTLAPAQAMEIVAKISNVYARRSALEYRASAWMKLDPKAAEAWIRGSPLLDEKTRQRMLEK